MSDDLNHSESVRSVRPRRALAPNLWLTLLAAIVVIGTAKLSLWQFDRAAQKESLQKQFEAQSTQRAKSSLRAIRLPEDRYANVKIDGAFDRDANLLHDNQIQSGKAGLHAYALFRPREGGAVLVNRGWFPLPERRTNISAPQVPAAQISIEGRINLPAARTQRLAENTDTQFIVQTIELSALEKKINTPLAPYIIEQTQGDDALVRKWMAPDFKIATHRMYAGQWMCFSVLAAVLWLFYSFKKVSP